MTQKRPTSSIKEHFNAICCKTESPTKYGHTQTAPSSGGDNINMIQLRYRRHVLSRHGSLLRFLIWVFTNLMSTSCSFICLQSKQVHRMIIINSVLQHTFPCSIRIYINTLATVNLITITFISTMSESQGWCCHA